MRFRVDERVGRIIMEVKRTGIEAKAEAILATGFALPSTASATAREGAGCPVRKAEQKGERKMHTDDDSSARISQAGRAMIGILGLATSPVGVGFIGENADYPDGAGVLRRHRCCQALMKARRDQEVLLDARGVTCPAAAAAFVFKTLPEGLKSGKGLAGFGIVSDEAIRKRMFEVMPHLNAGTIRAIHLYPIGSARHVPDVVVVEDEIERLMWIALAYLHATGGARIASSTAILQATCVDSTIISYLSRRLNLSYGCYGYRDTTDIGPHETVLGFPGSLLEPITAHLKFLDQKAIPTSRGNHAYAMLRDRK